MWVSVGAAIRSAAKTMLEQRCKNTAIGNVMYGSDLAVSDEISNQVAVAFLAGEIDGWGSAFLAAQNFTEIDGLAEVRAVARRRSWLCAPA